MFTNLTKQKWIEEIENLLKRYFLKVNKVFQSNDSEGGNKYYYYNEKYLLAHVIFDCEGTLFVFNIFTNNKYEYRFFIKNKFFWQIDRKTGIRSKKATNWVEIYQNNKYHLDNHTNKYNMFFIASEYIDFEGAGHGMYGVNLLSLNQLLSDISKKHN
ncbi:hypothetical protein ELUMI_v1c05090 [Williamsoniiplasma luminosum]|uniref:Uncharacterized protein n=1 Tax=Williamsoniiplasma luminosum TaxID=214888 RepID=A0A2K8NX72_9MOLU|nr:hypothetical protein [Williamsoniiplasma luminosum]ATZ17233.1 hypothetical protein ELUMI_v1c05090 [Williamsoniiplasma luminosum]